MYGHFFIPHLLNKLIIRKIKRFLFKNHLFIFFTLHYISTYSQQTPQFSQYLQNPFVINPAMTGVENYIDINASHRNQWLGFDGAPRTSTFSINSSLYRSRASYLPNEGTTHHGLGVFLYTDTNGPLSQNGLYGSYAYHLKVSEEWFLSFGTFAGVSQFRFDDRKVVLLDNPIDPLVQNVSELNFDLSFGLYAYSKYLFLGIAANKILNKEIRFSDASTEESLLPSYNLLLGSRISINDALTVVPFSLLKTVKNSPIQWDAGIKTVYNDKFWGGLAYRNEEAIIGFLGLRLTENLLLSYSYDWITADFSTQQSGSHEIIIGYRFNPRKLLCACPQYSL
ncbi:type IX secretion system membrane protein PorP/SprF [Seonamhaeicola sediminis]|uniref:Type IX secretion system membrane protein PorP/SprF n=1 Tax=Seonamhaeicola sediminis TaxID=2528206 RepID=A0A562YDS3_9FLAO|nr:type IX secretion system membrane protein PorP/SprF [Seonamhaeicola sediminis]TWO32740.1 type IX secretion system membrane protein PorP/SprF [Seonamhaeicola sediminis]